MALELHFQEGYVSAFYVIFLDLILFTNLDAALARLLSSLYYKQIFKGKPLLLRSCDIPGISTFFLGNRLSPNNLSILALKLAFISCALILDLNINSKPLNFHTEVRLLSTCLLYTSPSPRDQRGSRMPSSA